MNYIQYYDLCKIFGKNLTDKELKEMGFSLVDGVFDEDVEDDIEQYKFEQFKGKCRNERN